MSLQTKYFYEFRPFRLDPEQHLLTRNGEAISLTPKAFETLRILVEKNRQVLSKEELMNQIWPETFVEEGNLTFNISVLRKALGKRPDGCPYIETVPKYGYRFSDGVSIVQDESAHLVIQEHSRSHVLIEEEIQEEVPQHDWSLSETDRTTPLVSTSGESIRLRRWLPFLVGGALAALLAVLVALDIPDMRGRVPDGKSTKPSVVVLPFVNLSSEKDQEYFSDGLTDELINALSKLEGLNVVARTSAFKFKGKAEDVRRVGALLNVGLVLEGCVLKAEDKLRVTAQLVSVSDGYLVWSGSYEREVKDVFAIQEEIAQAIVRTLQIKFTDEKGGPLVKRYTEDLQAYNLYLTGCFFRDKRTEEGFQKSIQYFEQAIAKDPQYALAYAGMAYSYFLLGNLSVSPPKDIMPKAKAAAMAALAIDPKLAAAYPALGRIESEYDLNWTAAEQDFKHAIEFNPGYSTAHHWYSIYLVFMGRLDEALTEAQRAQELDPLSLMICANLGWVLFQRRQYGDAIDQLQRTIEMDSTFYSAHLYLGRAYTHSGNLAQAIVELEKAWQLEKNPLILGYLGLAHAKAGHTAEAHRLLAKLLELRAHRFIRPSSLAEIYIGLGDKDRAFEWLEMACADERACCVLNLLKVDPLFDSLRPDSRFTALLEKVGLNN
jgi:TolB-like protein/DNA-binding winged helix-turn-helix (wHTH) protein/Tfp pilus assembly protein PilF